MHWNWELKDWPKFRCNFDEFWQLEKQFLLGVGGSHAFLKSIKKEEFQKFIIEILTSEGSESSRIEGEILERESLQSSIKKHFKVGETSNPQFGKEAGIATVLCNLYESFNQPLTDFMLFEWHDEIFKDTSSLEDCGKYRTHDEPMQIVSRRYGDPKIFFEAPPSKRIPREMSSFIKWFNSPLIAEPILVRAAITHVYFESIHPFEDGNGRIGRFLVEKIIAKNIGQPTLIAISKTLEKHKKPYYSALEKCNRTLDVSEWVHFFVNIILQAQKESMDIIHFLIEKSKLLTRLSGQLNLRQEKALLRIFEEGPDGFRGGLSAENYISITKSSRATTTRDLVDLVQKGALIKTGELRHTRYWLPFSLND